MAVNNRIQFAVVREDPEIELALLPPGPSEALLVASGGCTALTVAARRPDVRLTLVDPNPAQLDLVARKVAALSAHPPGSAERARLFGTGADDAHSLTGCGNFESLFRGLRSVLDDLVMPCEERRRVLVESATREALVESRYWPVAFQMFFSDAFLETMFGREATQHAEKGSYPDYFRRVIERGLARTDAATNYLLHHILLGHYLDTSQPEYLAQPCAARFEMVQANMAGAPPFDRYALISLSNIFDWMDATGIEAIARRLCAECRPGAVIVIRQLNNRAPVERFFDGAFRFDTDRAALLLARDRSLFYQRLLVGVWAG